MEGMEGSMSLSRGLLIAPGPSGREREQVRAAVFANNQFQYVYSVSALRSVSDGKDYYFVSRERVPP